MAEYTVVDYDEEMDVKPDIDELQAAAQIESIHEFNSIVDGCGDGNDEGTQSLSDIHIQQRLLIMESRLDDLEEKIEQKFQTMMRKQDSNFAVITSKLDILQKSLSHLHRPANHSFLSPPPAKKVAVVSNTNKHIPQQIVTPTETDCDSDPDVVEIVHPPIQTPSRPLAPPKKLVFPVPMIMTVIGKRPNPVPVLPRAITTINPEEILRFRPLVKTMSDMAVFEKNLQITSYRQSVLTNISMIGGNSLQSEIANIIKSLMSNVVQANYSFKGAKGKDSFNSTLCWDVVRQCVQERYPGTTIDQVRKGVSDLLRNAPGKLKSYVRKVGN